MNARLSTPLLALLLTVAAGVAPAVAMAMVGSSFGIASRTLMPLVLLTISAALAPVRRMELIWAPELKARIAESTSGDSIVVCAAAEAAVSAALSRVA